MSEASATHVASGKVREIYALDDERLLLVASDRISTFDVSCRRRSPTRDACSRGMSAFWFARTREIVPNHLLDLGDDGRSTVCRRLEMLPSSSSSAVTCPAPAGSTTGRRVGMRPRAAAGPPRIGPPARADRDARDEGRGGARPQHHRGRGRRVVRRRARTRSHGRPRLRLYAFASAHAEARGISSPTPSSSSASTATAVVTLGRRGPHPRLVALLAGRRRTGPAVRSPRSTSSSCATSASRPAGIEPTPVPRSPTTSSPAPAHATSRHSSS